jgi:hypothetical protein
MNKDDKFQEDYNFCKKSILDAMFNSKRDMTPPTVAYLLMQITTELAFQCAPSRENAILVLHDFVNQCIRETIPCDCDE